MSGSIQRLARRQLWEMLGRYVSAVDTPRPRDGWISAIREALEMTHRQFAARLGIAQSNAVRLEQREQNDTISLGALRRAADALDCDLIYAVVPRHGASTTAGDNLLEAVIQTRAHKVAAAQLRHIAHTMTLEAQPVLAHEHRAQIADLAAELAEAPRRLWDPDVEPRVESKTLPRLTRPR